MNRVLSPNEVEASQSTISDAIRLHAALDPDRPAILSADLPALSFGDLDRTIRQVGDGLRAAAVGAGSRVGVMVPHEPEAALVAVAVSSHAIGYPLSPTLTAAEFEHELDRTGLDAIVLPDWVDLPAAGVARARPMGVLHVSKAVRSLAEIRLNPVVDIPVERRRSGVPSAHSVAVIQTSSGSTGLPKHVLVTHANLFDVASKVRTWYGVGESDRSACLLPVHAGLGFKVTLLAPLLIGSSVVITRKQRAEDITEWCADCDPTWFFGAPAYLNAVLDKLRSVGMSHHSLRFFVTGGTYFPEPLRKELEAILNVPGLEQYGAREAGPITANPAPPAKRKPGTVGPIATGVAILGDDGATLPAGKTGAVAVRGQGISPGYIEALPIGSDTVPVGRSPNDWFLTGDVGIVDGDGFLSIVGRAKQIINRGGEKIAPAEVEKALLLHPAVRETVVFGVPHPRLGESVAAAVVLRPDAKVTSADLQYFLYEHVAPFKIPQRVHVVSTLPRTQAGKVHVAELKERFSNYDRDIVPPEGNLEPLIIEIWERLLGVSDIGVDDNFFELGGDSLLATMMLLEVEALARRRISPAALRGVWTVRQVTLALVSDNPADHQLMTTAKEGRGTPFFFCHGDHRDRGVYAFRLADLIKQDVPIVLLNHYRDFAESPRGSLEDMARLYVPHLIALQPAGGFRIGGYCVGGLLAWEIAHQLKATGRDVEHVVLVDSPSLNGHPGLRALKKALDAICSVCPRVIREKIEGNGMWAAWVSVRSGPAVWSALAKFIRLVATKWIFADARPPRWDEYRRLSNYLPRYLDVKLFCLVCADNAARIDFRPSNWRRLVPSLEIKTVPGDHHSCVTRFGHVVASELERIIVTSEPNVRRAEEQGTREVVAGEIVAAE